MTAVIFLGGPKCQCQGVVISRLPVGEMCVREDGWVSEKRARGSEIEREKGRKEDKLRKMEGNHMK